MSQLYVNIVKSEIIHRVFDFAHFFKNTQFFIFFSTLYLNLYYFAHFHLRLQSVKKTNIIYYSNYLFTPQMKNHMFAQNKCQKKITLNIVAITSQQLQFWVYNPMNLVTSMHKTCAIQAIIQAAYKPDTTHNHSFI